MCQPEAACPHHSNLAATLWQKEHLRAKRDSWTEPDSRDGRRAPFPAPPVRRTRPRAIRHLRNDAGTGCSDRRRASKLRAAERLPRPQANGSNPLMAAVRNPFPLRIASSDPVGLAEVVARCGPALGRPSTQRHISRRRAPMSTGAAGRGGIASAEPCTAAMRRVKSPRTSSGRKRERGAITWLRPWRCWCAM